MLKLLACEIFPHSFDTDLAILAVANEYRYRQMRRIRKLEDVKKLQIIGLIERENVVFNSRFIRN